MALLASPGLGASSKGGVLLIGTQKDRMPSFHVHSRSSRHFSMICKCASESTAERLEQQEQEARAVALLRRYVDLNSGSWSGTFTQYDAFGEALACIPTRVKANVYGKGEHLSLYQTLSVKQAKSPTSVSGDDEEPEWIEFTLEEHDVVTLEQRHKIGYFPDEKAYCLSYMTASIPDAVLRTGLLGEDDDEERDVFPGVKLPCRRPALVNESCLFSDDGNTRLRAFHVLNPQGGLDTIGVFHEHRDEAQAALAKDDSPRRMDVLAGEWTGQAKTRRTGLYGSTTADEKIFVGIKEEKDGKLVQRITTLPDNRATTEFLLHGQVCGDLINFTEGMQTTLLPGGMFLTCPVNVATCVQKFHSFCLEFGWIHGPQQRRRLTRTYDTSGAVVSTTLSMESKA